MFQRLRSGSALLFFCLSCGCRASQNQAPATPTNAPAPPTPETWIADCETQGQRAFPAHALHIKKTPVFDLRSLTYVERSIESEPRIIAERFAQAVRNIDPDRVRVATVIGRLSLYDSNRPTVEALASLPSGIGLGFTDMGWSPDVEVSDAWVSTRLHLTLRHKKTTGAVLHSMRRFIPEHAYHTDNLRNWAHESQAEFYSLNELNRMRLPELDTGGLAGLALAALLPRLEGRMRLMIESVQLMSTDYESYGCFGPYESVSKTDSPAFPSTNY